MFGHFSKVKSDQSAASKFVTGKKGARGSRGLKADHYDSTDVQVRGAHIETDLLARRNLKVSSSSQMQKGHHSTAQIGGVSSK